ncbi:MAG: hypothetical protein Q4F18_12955 [Clostridia bacterium]|nr:hypothetical protein [Clostridia bacterium]
MVYTLSVRVNDEIVVCGREQGGLFAAVSAGEQKKRRLPRATASSYTES